jgi:hypothetical protein
MKKNPMNNYSINLINDEFWFLISQYGPSLILGMDNPYQGCLTEELEEASRRSIISLIDRGYVRLLSKDSIELDDVVANMVKTCAHPVHSLIIKFQPSLGNSIEHFIHFSPGWIVERMTIDENIQELTVFKDTVALKDYLRDALRLDSRSNGSTKPFHIDEDSLLQISSLYKEGKKIEGKKLLEQINLDAEVKQCLDEVFSNPVANSSVIALHDQNDPEKQKVLGFAFLEGQEEMWLLQPEERVGKRQVNFSPANAELICQQFAEILPEGI